jgi:benzoyl-CoA reductase subunit C
MDAFYEAATHVQNKPILEWKDKGKKIVGYTCSYVPAEIFYAADILPVRLRGIETDGMEIGDSYYGPFICSFPKCILQLAGKGMFSFLDGAVITPGCDAMRRLDECWRKAGEDYEGIVPSYFYYFDVPHKTEPHGMKWFVQEIGNLIESIEQHFDIKITDEKLKKAIQEYNKGRRMLKAIEDLRAEKELKVSGTDVFAATVAGTVMPRDDYTQFLERWLGEIKQSEFSANGKKRLMLVGSISDDIDLVELMEKNTDSVVVAENLCFGVRYEGNEIPEDGDPVEALAKHYLGKSVCPRMFGKYKERLAFLKEKIERARVDGVVMQNIRFCDLHGAENSLFERDLEAIGVPCIRIEREYGPLIETGRMKLRINAFLERIS